MEIDRFLFHGIYEIAMDSGRITIPALFRTIIYNGRDAKDTSLLLCCDADGVTRVFPQQAALSEETAGRTELVRLDRRGRIRLPMDILETLRIETSGRVVLNGGWDCFELWSAVAWMEAQRQEERDFPVSTQEKHSGTGRS